jgi:hypothetical protein
MKRTVKTTHSVCTVNISSQRINEEKNRCAALNATNGAMSSVQANVKTGLTSPAVTVLTTRVIYVTFTTNLSFQFGKTCY